MRRRRRPTGTFQRLGLTRSQLQKQKQRPTATSAGPTAAQKAKLVAALKAAKAKAKPTGTPRPNVTIRDPKIKSKPTGTPRLQKLKPGAIAPQRLPSKPPTSAQRAAMRKQAIARRGNTAKQRVGTEAAARRAVRRGDATPGQVRSYRMARQKRALGKSMPKRTTKRTSRRLV
jgi:hypothetical protein